MSKGKIQEEPINVKENVKKQQKRKPTKTENKTMPSNSASSGLKTEKNVVKTKVSKPALKNDDAVENGVPDADGLESVEKGTKTQTHGQKVVYTRVEIMEQFDELLLMLNNQLTDVKQNGVNTNQCKQNYQLIIKEVKKLRKNSRSSIKNKGNYNKNPNIKHGFKNPMPITDKLSEFANWPKGEMKSRIDVTRLLCNYIKDNNLQKPTNRIFINPDEKLQKLLDPNKEYVDNLKYTNMQKLITPLFITS